ncbi:MAG: ATP synthase subunit I [Oscillospiraceae bacterium]|nr:ATP synthase subunit I [Oscillospiraceae bacterium]
MKLQAASRKEVSRIALGVLICDGLMVAALFLLSQFGIGTFDLIKILLGALIGSVVAIVNFAILCLTVQSALNIENKRKMKARFQMSYNVRLLIQAGWVVGAFFLREKIHFVAAAAPVLFPHVVIFYLQFKGKLMPADPPKESSADTDTSGEEETAEVPVEDEDEEDDNQE